MPCEDTSADSLMQLNGDVDSLKQLNGDIPNEPALPIPTIEQLEDPSLPDTQLRRSQRVTKQPLWLVDYVTPIANNTSQPSMRLPKMSDGLKPCKMRSRHYKITIPGG